MKKIEQEMVKMIKERRAYWQKANMRTELNKRDDRIDVYLHGNKIAEVYSNEILVSDSGWQTSTTKSRLNVLIVEFTDSNRIYQKNFRWYIGNELWRGGKLIPRTK